MFEEILYKKIYLRYSDEKNDINRLNLSIKELEKNFEDIFQDIEDNDKLKHLLKECFIEGYTNTCYFTNASYTYTNEKGEEKESRKLYLRPQKTRFLVDNIDDDLTLSFRGYIKEGFFVINEIKIIGNYERKKEFEEEIKIIPYHTNIPKGYRGEYLNKLIDSTQSIIEHLNKNLKNWEEYLRWREELVKIRLVGIKYFNYYYEKQLIVFHLVSPSKNEFDKIRKYFKKENIKVFDNEYSKDKWIFRFNEKNRSRKNAFGLGKYSMIIKEIHYKPSEKEIEQLNKQLQNKKEKGEDFIHENFKEDIEAISDNPYFIEMAFELDEDTLDHTKDLSKEEIKEYVHKNIFKYFNNDGFIALSAVGDFALIRRLSSTIASLKRDEGYCPNLALWLFDIKKAEIPNIDSVKIDKWLNKSIENNIEQNMAVRKMLAVKDICLIQGPPGTGKTTVIAEVIYQFVLRKEKVLIASQTNLAVDNALERLEKDPNIRAIRLNAQKNAISNMTENKVIEFFFGNISNELKNEYLNKWEESEKLLNNLDFYLRDIKQYVSKIEQYREKLNNLKKEKEELYNEIKSLNEQINNIKNKNSNLNRIRSQINLFIKFIKENNNAEFVLPKDYINLILDDINYNLHSLENIKIDALNLNSDNMKEDILTEGTKEIYKNINYFYELKENIKYFSDIKKPSESTLLDNKINEIKDKMGDENISDEEYDKLSKEYRELTKKRSELKNDNSFKLKETYKALLDSNIINEYNNSNNTNIIKEYIDKNIKKIDEIKKVFDDIEEYSNLYKDSLKEEDTKVLENKLKTLEGKIKTIDEEESNLKNSINEDNKKIDEIKTKNNISYETPNIYNILSNKRDEIKNILENQKEFRDKFESFIKDFNERLENIDIDCENEYFKNTYINSCNVVGISCTENRKILEEKDFNAFDVVIIDEVSKATPPELLLPMLKAKKVILVGDHRQLPPLFGEYEKSYREIIDTIEDTDEKVKSILTIENFKKYENMD